MDLSQKNVKKLLYVLTFAIVLFWGVQNIPRVAEFLGWVWSILTPFAAGLCIAFILNVPMSAFEKFFKKKRRRGRALCKGWERFVRPVSLLLSFACILSIVIFVLTMIIPQIAVTIGQVADAAVRFVPQAQSFLNSLSTRLEDYPEYQKILMQVVPDWNQLLSQSVDFLKGFSIDALVGSIDAASSIFSGLVNVFLTVVFSIYVVVQKENLSRQARRFLYAFLPERAADTIVRVAGLSYRTFYTFVTVQCTEAAILAVLCFVGMTIFRFPYALMISVMMFVLALIPLVGAIISCVLGAFFIMMVDPVQALWFVVFILVLQQVEGNLIYPRVVSSSFGLPPMWVLIAVTVGSSMLGMVGLLVGVPTTCVLYTLVRERMHVELARKNISREKLEPDSDAAKDAKTAK